MNFDTYLDFLYEMNMDNLIYEKTVIKKFSRGKEIERKNISKRRMKIKKAIMKAKLEDGSYILVDDYPLNFLTSQTILIGEKTNLVEISLNGNKEEKYICEKNLLDKLEELKPKIINTVIPKELFRKRFSYNFEIPEIMIHLKEYLDKIKKTNLNKIHLSKNNKIENFNPTLTYEHLELASKLKLLVIPLVKENFLRESVINVHDTIKQIEIINPMLTYEIKEQIEVERKTSNRIYKDIETNYFIKVNPQLISHRIREAKKSNIKKEKLINRVKGIEKIHLSRGVGNYAIPLWKIHKDQNFIQIKDRKHFKEITGISFRLENNLFEGLYIQSKDGEVGLYKTNYLSENLENSFKSLKKSTTLEFEDDLDLVVKVLYNREFNTLIQKEKISKYQINKLKKEIKKVIEKTILETVRLNKIPKFERQSQTFDEIYFENINYHFDSLIFEYSKNQKSLVLLNSTVKALNNLCTLIKKKKLEYESLIHLVVLIKKAIEILKIFDSKAAEEIDKLSSDFFKETKIKVSKSNFDIEIVNIANDIILANKLSEKEEISLIEIFEFDKSHLNSKIKIFKKPPKYNSVLKPQNKKLKEIFPYSYKDVSKQINKIPKDKIKKSYVKFRGKVAKISEEFYKEEIIFENYKKIAQNRNFILVRLRPNNKKTTTNIN